MNTSQAPETLGYRRSATTSGTPRNGTAARGVPFPPLRSSGTGTPEPGTPPHWLADKIDSSRRAAKLRDCSKCGQPLLVGPSADEMFWTARVDADPVDALTETVALLTSRRMSYDLIRGRLHVRGDHHTHTPRRPHPVLLDHACPGRPTGVLF